MFRIFLLLFLFTSVQIFAQLTLTSSIIPTVGETEKNIECDTTGITQGNAGANQTWNFSGISRIDSLTLTWVNPASTPYAPQFPTSNLASTIDNSSYQYFTASSSNILVNGFGNSGSVVAYNNPQTFITFPFTYNSTFTDNFSANYNISGSDVVRTGSTTVTGDAYGIITLPNGTFTNSLRVRYIVNTKDSSNPGFPVVINTSINSYVWFVPGRKFPVFEIIYTTSDINGMFPSSGKIVSYHPDSPPIGITNLNTGVVEKYELSQNYPNPFNPETNIKFGIPHQTNVTLKVYDGLGREVATLAEQMMPAGSYSVNFNASQLTSGTYYYSLKTDDFTEFKKMILIK